MAANVGNTNLETTVMNRQAYKVEKIIGVHMGEVSKYAVKYSFSIFIPCYKITILNVIKGKDTFLGCYY